MNLTKEQKLFKKVLQEAWENESFKRELIADPVATIEKLTGDKINVPDGRNLVIVDQSNTENLYFNIPADPSSMVLTEEQLEAVAGGGDVQPQGGEDGWYPYPGWPFNPY